MRNTTKLATVAAIGMAALPLGLATPAHASESRDGCTITALDPYFAGTYDAYNRPEVIYSYELTCDPARGPRKVTVKTQTWEQDLAGRNGDVDADGVQNADDEHIGNATTTRKFSKAGGTKTVLVKGILSSTDDDGNDEMYHKVKLRVESGGVVGGWSDWDLSQAVRIWW